ncbi:MAG TPA: hypothetical protein EYQ24_14085 [Bacteroidetes bacterium]|nr:hypothetical protein [Bacteroidota bacterium]
MPSFLLLAGLGSYLVIGLLCVAAFAVAGVGAYYYLRAKNREALDPAKGLGTAEAPAALGEMRELTSRIEEIVTTQQDHGETQRAHLSRKIDQVRESVESQHHAVTGLRHELRHEIDRRDAEMSEIRNQIASVREGLALPPAERAALPPGPSAAELGAPETEAEMRPIAFTDQPEAEDATFTETTATDEAPAESGPAFDEVAFAPLDAGPGDEAGGLAFAFEDDDAAGESPLFAFEDAPFGQAPDAPAFEDTPDPLSPAALPAFAFEDDDAPETGPPAVEAPAFAFEETPSEMLAAEPPAEETPEAPAAHEELAPAFAFEDDEAEASTAAPPAFAFEDDEGTAPAEEAPAKAFEVVSFLEPEASAEPVVSPFAFAEDDGEEVSPMALAFNDDELATLKGAASAAEPSGGNGSASGPPPPSPTFTPAIPARETEETPRETAWISRHDRQDDTPTETIGGIAVERVGDVPPLSAETPEPEAPAASPAPPFTPQEFDDEFPAPVVASELAVEASFDFGIDVDAELAAFEQPALDDAASAPESEPLAHAPVPPFQMDAPADEPLAASSAETPSAEAPSAPLTETPLAPAPSATPEPQVEPEPYTPPEGAEDLTVLSSVDEDTRRALHMAGVLTLDEIARWGRSDARRIAGEVGVSEETIMHQWVFEAQSALFERYSRR